MTGRLRHRVTTFFAALFGARSRGAGEGPRDDVQDAVPPPRPHNLFEAAAVHVAARADNDDSLSAEAACWVSQEALAFGVSELACRALIALAREHDEPPQSVARALLGLPAG
jgi:hypothetical protein